MELEKLTYEALEEIADSRLEKISALEETIEYWKKSFHQRPKHVLCVEQALTDEQFSRLREHMNEMFGIGNVILLEGGIKYIGMTHHPLSEIPQTTDNQKKEG